MKKMKKSTTATLYWVQGALIAALYVVLNYAQELILPMSTSGTVQIRLAEMLSVFAVFTPSAIPGLAVGCLLSNLITVGVLPLDMILGTGATLLAAVCAYLLRNVKLFKVPVLSLLMPVVFNAVIIGLELEIFYVQGGFEFMGFLTQAGFVALGELVACVVLGIPFYFVLGRIPIIRKLQK